jgi:hypothetical protein
MAACIALPSDTMRVNRTASAIPAKLKASTQAIGDNHAR